MSERFAGVETTLGVERRPQRTLDLELDRIELVFDEVLLERADAVLTRDRAVELERERDLQNKSLNLLHQQLELARETGPTAAEAGSDLSEQETPESSEDGTMVRMAD